MAAFKDEISPAVIGRLAAAITTADPAFDAERFHSVATAGLEGLELKARVDQVARAMAEVLPADFTSAVGVVRAAVGPGTLDGWALWPVTAWVPLAGSDHPEDALAFLRWVTPRSSGEFAVRPFIDRDPDRLLGVLVEWAADPDEHVRRLASEGSRPRLPWGARLVATRAQPGWAVPIVEKLYDDPSEYVRRSVANHLNDICYEDRDLGLATAARWWATERPGAQRVVRHGLRALVKKGDPDALALLGVHPPDVVEVDGVRIGPARLPIGGTATIELAVRNVADHPVHIVVDYAVQFVGARGTARKVFKGKMLDLPVGADAKVTMRHAFRDVSIRTHRPGIHLIEVQCNGAVAASGEIELTP